MTTPQEAVDVLNRVHADDPRVMPILINFRTVCNEVLANDATVQVGVRNGSTEVGLLGILNGIFGVKENGWGYIAAIFDDDKLLRFEVLP